MPSLIETMEDATSTLRPSAVSLPPYRPAEKRRRVPAALWLGAAASVAAAVVAYRLGPYSEARPNSGAPATRVAATLERAEATPLHAAPVAKKTDDAKQDVTSPQRLMVTVVPSHAYLSIRTPGEREGKRTGGPWPKAFDLEPGEYEVVAHRRGLKPVVRRIHIRAGVRPPALELHLQVDDIYE
jgi:hypothetical protein